MYKLFIPVLLLALYSVPLHAVATDTLVGVTAPAEESRNYQQLTHFLCDGLSSQEEKVCAIYNWITHNIAYDVKSLQKGSLEPETAVKTFRRRKGVCEGYARLFAGMCETAGIPVIKINGYAKDWNFDDGDKLYIPRHCWNAVRLNNKWQLVDATWGAGSIGQKPGWLHQLLHKKSKKPSYSGKLKFNFQYDPQYCLQPADSFRIKHLPIDPWWQLADEPMPISVFEKGQTAIVSYNQQHPMSVAANPDLNQLAALSEAERMYECADRAYEFNSRFLITKAVQYELHGLSTMAILAGDSDRKENRQVLYNETLEKYKLAEDLIKKQKKNISAEYQELKRKNKTKSAEATRYVQSLRNDNKRLVAQCKAKIRAADGKYRSINGNYGQEDRRKQEIDPDKLRTLKTIPFSKSINDPELIALLAGVANRGKSITALNDSIAVVNKRLEQLKTDNKQRLEDLAGYLQTADSALVRETIERIRMHDNYDEEVKVWSAMIKVHKYELGDTLHQQYLRNYDAILVAFDLQKRLQKDQIALQKNNLRELEQYRRQNNTNLTLAGQYKAEAAACREGFQAYLAILQKQAGYIKGNKELFGSLVRIYERQDKLTAYMERAEKHRKQAEEKYFTKKEAFDMKENKQQQQRIERDQTQAGEEYARIVSGKKKKLTRRA